MRSLFFVIGFLSLLQPLFPVPKEIPLDENELFSEETVTPVEKLKDETIQDVAEKEGVAFSGSINTRNAYAMNRNWLLGKNASTAQNQLNNRLQNNFTLEARARHGTRAIVNFVNNIYAQSKSELKTMTDTATGQNKTYSESTNADYRFTEAFVDTNIARAVYFRVGKQVLVWGRGFFWNPSDVINAELRSATDAFQFREGTYGLRMHIPVGTFFNFYSFTGVGNSNRAEDVLQALKAEFALKYGEVAFGTVVGKNKVPTLIAEGSARIATIDVRVETTFAKGDNRPRIDSQTFNTLNPTTYLLRDTPVFKGVLSVGRSFELFDVADRLGINLEYFYNGAGYKENIFDKNAPLVNYFVQNGIYRPNYYGMHYLGFFVTVAKFFVNDMTLALNGFTDLSDGTLVASEMLSYAPLFNFTLTWQNNIFTGNPRGEYTTSGMGWYTELSARVTF
ncbi:MAG TPA: hypothetical protein PLY93_01715 [Turneriella sp.]|nr:hypothetical protein [Turneriella sp.]